MDSIMVDPRLAMPFHDFLNKPQKPAFAISPSIWDQQLNTSIPLLGDQIGLDNPTEAKDDGDVEMIGLCSSHAAGIKTSSRALSNSSIPSLTSSSLSQSSHQTKKQARKPKIKKRQQDLVRDVSRTKRKQYLERNRIAASKCRQKKKDWTHELEEIHRLLQSKHQNLQHEYNTLSEAVLQMKNILMAHWSCHDHNIDQWINDEARKFAQQPTDGSINGLGDHTFRFNPSGILSLSVPNSRHQTPNSLISFFPSNSIPCAAITTDALNPLINTTPSTDISDDGLPCDVCIPPTQTTDNLQLNQGTWPQEPSPRDPSVEQANMEMLQEGPKPTASKIQRKDLGKDEEINEHWSDRSRMNEAVHEAGRLEERLQGWNKYQMGAVQTTSTNPSRQIVVKPSEKMKDIML